MASSMQMIPSLLGDVTHVQSQCHPTLYPAWAPVSDNPARSLPAVAPGNSPWQQLRTSLNLVWSPENEGVTTPLPHHGCYEGELRSQGSNSLPRAQHSGTLIHGISSTPPAPCRGPAGQEASPEGQAVQVSSGPWVDLTWRLLALLAGRVTRPLRALILPCPSHPWNSGS